MHVQDGSALPSGSKPAHWAPFWPSSYLTGVSHQPHRPDGSLRQAEQSALTLQWSMGDMGSPLRVAMPRTLPRTAGVMTRVGLPAPLSLRTCAAGRDRADVKLHCGPTWALHFCMA